jgi:hypothetical protein
MQPAGNSGGPGSSGGPGNAAAGNSPVAGMGGGSAVCADASSDPEVVTAKPPLPVRFVLLYDPAVDDPANVAAWDDDTAECGSGAIDPFGTPGFSPWSECIGRHLVQQTNAGYAKLLGTSAPLLSFDSFTSVANASLARGRLKDDLPGLVMGLAQPGVVNAFLVLSIADASGVAELQQDYPNADSGVVVILRAENGWSALAHELGHAIGFPHVAGATVGPQVSYPCCGGAQVKTLQGGCNRDTSNVMCESGGSVFDTCEHGAFLKKIAACWLSGKGGRDCQASCDVFASDSNVPVASCVNSGSGLDCQCADNGPTYTATDCADAVINYQDHCDLGNP